MMRTSRVISIALLGCCGAVLTAVLTLPTARAQDARPQPPAQPTLWKVWQPPGGVRQRRDAHAGHDGDPAEEILVEGGRDATPVIFDRPLPKPARTLPELTASVWVRANRGGAKIYLRVLFPNQKDPTTGNLLTTYILLEGDPRVEYSSPGHWQQLVCGTPDRALQDQIRQLRWRFYPETLDLTGSYVERVVITCPTGPEPLKIELGDPHIEPLVEAAAAVPVAEQARVVRPIAEIHQGQLQIAGRSRLTLMVADHGEDLGTLQQMHVNTVFMRLRGAADRARLAALRERGIFGAAEPPRDPKPIEQLSADGLRATPRAYESPEILLWYLGTCVSSQDREEVSAQIEQLRAHDYRLRRPTLIDVVDDERYYSRYVSMLSTSERILGTSFTFKDYRNWLLERSRLANAGTYLFTWIQTEPVPAANDWRIQSRSTPIVVEPEQIRLQVYGAIMAGYRGLGYWSRTSMESTAPGAVERRLQIAQLNLELGLIEPFLASANLGQSSTFKIDDKTPKPTRKIVDFPRDSSDLERSVRQKLAENDNQQKNKKLMPQEMVAAVFDGANYQLVIASWLSHDAQCVPGKLAVSDAKVLVPEPSENAHFWELTTTGVHPLHKEKTVGAYLVTVPKFDQTAMILVSTDPGWQEQVEEHVRKIAPESARISIDLARAKLERVRKVDVELNEVGAGQPDGVRLFSRAERSLQEAEWAFQRHDFDKARDGANEAMQAMRILQYAHWNESVTQGEYGALTSPYTVSFQTLPEHYRLIRRLGRTADNPQDNELPSGDFESQRAIRAGWTQSQHPVEGVQSQAELYPSARKGKSALRLIAIPRTGIDPPVIITTPPVSVTSPAMLARRGQILHVSGWVKVIAPPSHSLNGITVSDNIDEGPMGWMLNAVRFTEKSGWQRFQMLREVRADGPYTLTLTLHGLGEVLFDDVQVIPHQVHTIRARRSGD